MDKTDVQMFIHYVMNHTNTDSIVVFLAICANAELARAFGGVDIIIEMPSICFVMRRRESMCCTLSLRNDT